MRLGAIDGDPGIRPQYHQFTASAAVWDPLPEDGLPLDPWDRDYHYDPPTTPKGTPRVYSYGKDGKPGGTGEDADIVNEPR